MVVEACKRLGAFHDHAKKPVKGAWKEWKGGRFAQPQVVAKGHLIRAQHWKAETFYKLGELAEEFLV